MAHIVCITTGLTGIVHASFEAVARLKAAGHRVTYACPVDVQSKVEAQGIAFVRLPEVNFDPAPKTPAPAGRLRSVRKGWRAIIGFRSRRRIAIASLKMDVVREKIDALSPDLVLLDMELHDHIITIQSAGIPLILLDQFFCSWRRPFLPPIYSRIVPGQGRWGSRFGISLYWQRRVMKSCYANFVSAIRNGFFDRRSVLLAYARSVGFPVRELQSHNWPPPFTYRSFTVVSMTCEDLDFPHPLRAAFHYVGPMVSADRLDPEATPELRQELASVFGRAKTEGKRVIYCGLTTMGQSELGFHRRLAEAVGARDDWFLLMGLGGQNKADDLGTLPANVRAYPWLPQLEALKHADCAIHHGGIHSINECLHFEVPMLVYSGGQHDQAGNTARIASHGIGMIGDQRTDDADRIRTRIQRLLDDEGIRKRLGVLSAEGRTPGRQQRLVRVVDEFLKAGD